MSKILAIRGHSTRGEEIIELFETMGGKVGGAKGYDETAIYVIPNNGIIDDRFAYQKHLDDYTIFTLEEFLEKFPFKIGNRVLIPEYESEVRICKMRWNPLCEYMEYMVYRNEDQEWYTAEELLNYNDNPAQCLDMDCCTNNITKSLDDVYSISKCKTIGQGTFAIKIADGYKFDSIDENGNIIVKSIKPNYPKTYEECCKNVFELVHEGMTVDVPMHYSPLIINFTKLLICRDAYWKIAGEQMGLGKPWEPNWDDENEYKYGLFRLRNIIYKDSTSIIPTLLIFPTIEMRDAFYDNFKDSIEQCKELL